MKDTLTIQESPSLQQVTTEYATLNTCLFNVLYGQQ